MSKRRTPKRRSRRYRSYKKNNSLTMVLIGGIALILLLVGWYLLQDRETPSLAASTDTLTYNPEDVVYDEGLFGVHEMGPSQTPIPFLPADGPQPKLEIPQTYWSFGQVGPRDVVDHVFVLKNVGDAPLTISRIYTTCGCTTAELSARVIPPGKIALLRVIFDAGYHDVRGQRVRRGVIIENNDPTNSQAEVWTEAAVRWK